MKRHRAFVKELHKFFKSNQVNKDLKERATKDIKTADESYEDLQRELQQKFDELFGPIED